MYFYIDINSILINLKIFSHQNCNNNIFRFFVSYIVPMFMWAEGQVIYYTYRGVTQMFLSDDVGKTEQSDTHTHYAIHTQMITMPQETLK